jgi:hypothetical protein
MCIVSFGKTVHNFNVLRGTFLGSDYTLRILHIEQVLSSHDRLQSVGNHDDCKVASLLLLHVKDCILDFSFTLRVKGACGFVKD